MYYKETCSTTMKHENRSSEGRERVYEGLIQHAARQEIYLIELYVLVFLCYG